MPFLSEKRVLILEETGLFSRACPELTDLIKTLPPETVLICSEEKIDDRSEQAKAVASSGCVAEFTMPSEADLQKWILGRLGKEHRPITKPALDMFLSRCSDDMWQISNDLEKLISYTFGKEGLTRSALAQKHKIFGIFIQFIAVIFELFNALCRLFVA